MSAADIRAGGGFIELWLEKTKLQQGMKSVQSDFKSWGSQISALGVGLTTLGGAIVAPFAISASAFAATGSQIDDFAQRTGMGAQAVSELAYAADQTGTSLEALEIGVGKMSQMIGKAIQGEAGAAEALAAIGLSATALKGMKPEDQLATIADRIAGIADVNVQTDLVRAIFGKGGSQLLPMLSQGAAGLAQFREEARRLGLSMSSEDVAAAAAFDDSLQALYRSLKGIGLAVGGAIVEPLKAASDLFVGISKPIGEFIKNNKGMVIGIAATGAALLATGVGLTTLGLGITLVGTAATGLAALGGVIAALALNPVTWLVAAGVAVVGVIGYVTGAFSAISLAANLLVEGMSQTVQGIANALKQGNLAAAWAIAGTALEIGWLTTVNYLKETFRNFTVYIVDAMANAGIALLTEFENIQADLGIQLIGVGDPKNALTGIKNAAHGAASASAASDAAELKDARQRLAALNAIVAPEPNKSAIRVPDFEEIAGSARDTKRQLNEQAAGTFSARGVLGLQNGSDLTRTAKNTEETAKNTKKMLDKFGKDFTYGP